MAGSGPAPNPASRRQTGSLSGSWLELPRAGFDGPIPDWPLVTNMRAASKLLNEDLEGQDIPVSRDAAQLDEREIEVWAAIWRTPQAAAWDLNGWCYDVGLYVRALVRGEFNDLDQAKEARMWSDRLGLNPTAMLKNRWRVTGDQVAAQRDAKKSPKKKARKLTVVDDAVAGS